MTRTFKNAEKGFIGFSALAVGYVSITSLIDPIATMRLVDVSLRNNDAISSIRGIFGGVGVTITLLMVCLLLRDRRLGMQFTIFFWGSYAASRLITIIVDGPLGSFGSQWILIETVLCLLGISLFILAKRFEPGK
ncbi:MAG: DUF4345 domain-containing protein [Bacteroidota bacterium]